MTPTDYYKNFFRTKQTTSRPCAIMPLQMFKRKTNAKPICILIVQYFTGAIILALMHLIPSELHS